MRLRTWIFTLVGVGLLVSASIHRFVLETDGANYVGHWSQGPASILLMAMLIILPMQAVLAIGTLRRKRRGKLIENWVLLVALLVVFVMSVCVIDPYFFIYAT